MPGFAGALRHLLLGHVKFARQALEGAGLLHRVEVGPLQVFDDGDLHGLLIGDLTEDGRDGGRLAGRWEALQRRSPAIN